MQNSQVLWVILLLSICPLRDVGSIQSQRFFDPSLRTSHRLPIHAPPSSNLVSLLAYARIRSPHHELKVSRCQ